MNKVLFSLVLFISFLLLSATSISAQGCSGSISCYDHVCSDGSGIACGDVGTKKCGLLNGYDCERQLRWTEGCQRLTCYTYTNACIAVPYCEGTNQIESCEEITGSCVSSAYCGDSTCNGSDTCTNCPGDCGTCPPACGTGGCQTGENCSNCPSDCGSCSGTTCSGSCMTAAANCGAYGMDAASGTCNSGEICCKAKSGYTPGCSWSTWEVDYPYCKNGEGNYCRCMELYGIACSGCATGLGGGGCFCPETCTPSCSSSCGQGNGCGGTCSNAANGSPVAPVLSYPASGRIEMATNGTITVDWNNVAKAEYYNYRIYPQGTSCSDTYAHCGSLTGNANSQYTLTPHPNGGNLYTIEVQAVNTTCGTDLGAWTTANFTIFAHINVSFLLDETGLAQRVGNVCELPGAPSSGLGTGSTLTAQGMYGPVNGVITGTTGRVTVPWWPSPGNNTVAINPGTFGANLPYICMCPQDCQYTGIASPTNINFFVSQIDLRHSGWYQTVGGNIYAGQSSGASALSPIPVITCDANATCISDIITKDQAANDLSAGIIITGGGNIDSSEDAGLQTGYVTERTAQTFAIGSTNTKIKENYDYFYREFSMGLTPSDDFTNPSDAAKPTVIPADDKRAYFHNGDLTIQSAWDIVSGESYVVFVDGNLILADPDSLQQLITVEQGGFIAFIVSGDITIQANVGNDDLDNITPNIEGVYIADGHINTPTRGVAAGGDDRFVGAGTFVGWTGVTLDRDFEDDFIRKSENNIRPVEMFIYRPDFVANIPERMARSRYIWQETN